MKNKLIKLSIAFLLAFVLLLSPLHIFASNGLAFVDEGQQPLAVTVSYYNDFNSRGFAWTTMEATTESVVQIVEKTSSTVNWSDAKTYVGTYTVDDEAYYLHKAYAEDLETGKEYLYRVGSRTNSTFSDTGTIKIDDGSEGIDFIFATDPQDYDEEGFSSWAKLVAASYATMPEAQFFACGGDIVNDSHNRLDHDYDQWIYALDLPKEQFMNSLFMPAAGNHDSYSSTFADRFAIDYAGSTNTGGYYSFDLGNMHFTVMNTNESNNMTTQIQWLEEDLGSTDKEWKILMLHKGLLSTGDHSNDSDVAELRESLIPLMAKYSVDLVLQGHDHVYVRTLPYNYGMLTDTAYYSGRVANTEEVYITEIEDGESITYSVEPNGTFYVTGNYAGRKSYPPVAYDTSLIIPATNPYNNQLMSIQIQTQTFCTISIRDNTLKFNTYLFNGTDTTLYDTYNVKKNTFVPVEKEIVSLPDQNEATILDFPNIADAYENYLSLTATAQTMLSDTAVEKLNALLTKYPIADGEKAYSVAQNIKNLGTANLSDEFRSSIKLVKASYNDLSAEQKELVTNYDVLTSLETEVNDLFVVQAFNEMLEDYRSSNSKTTIDELTVVYNKLSDNQKAKVDLQDVKLSSLTYQVNDATGIIVSICSVIVAIIAGVVVFMIVKRKK